MGSRNFRAEIQAIDIYLHFPIAAMQRRASAWNKAGAIFVFKLLVTISLIGVTIMVTVRVCSRDSYRRFLYSAEDRFHSLG